MRNTIQVTRSSDIVAATIVWPDHSSTRSCRELSSSRLSRTRGIQPRPYHAREKVDKSFPGKLHHAPTLVAAGPFIQRIVDLGYELTSKQGQLGQEDPERQGSYVAFGYNTIPRRLLD